MENIISSPNIKYDTNNIIFLVRKMRKVKAPRNLAERILSMTVNAGV